MLNPGDIKKDFPIFGSRPNLIYLDSAATSQKPLQVINAVTNFYEHLNSNVHRGIYTLSNEATEVYEATRDKVAQFISANSRDEIIFTGNTTEALNLIALSWANKNLKSGDVVVTTEMEHHSNYLPWLRLKKQKGINLVVLPFTKEYRLDFKYLLRRNLPKKKIKLVAITHASNVFGTVNPIKEIISYYKSEGINARFVVDAAQSAPHIKVDVQDLGCDFLAFSSHKMLGPAGVGVLWAKKELLSETEPLFVGGHMIERVTRNEVTYAPPPAKFEAGTGRLESVVGLGAAIDYLNQLGMNNIKEYETKLTNYALQRFNELTGVSLIGPRDFSNRLAVFSFIIHGVHPHDVAEILNEQGIAVRAGHHCAQPIMISCDIDGTTRASLYIYNTKDDIDKLIAGTRRVMEVFHPK